MFISVGLIGFVWFLFNNPFLILCLLIAEFNPFIFDVIMFRNAKYGHCVKYIFLVRLFCSFFSFHLSWSAGLSFPGSFSFFIYFLQTLSSIYQVVYENYCIAKSNGFYVVINVPSVMDFIWIWTYFQSCIDIPHFYSFSQLIFSHSQRVRPGQRPPPHCLSSFLLQLLVTQLPPPYNTWCLCRVQL